MNRLWNAGLDLERLGQIGVTLGADVPFFIGGESALAEGIGERLTPWRDPPETALVLVNPGVPLSTARVFNKYAQELTKPAAMISMPHAWTNQGDLAFLENDLEGVAKQLAPVVEEVCDALENVGALKVLMSGSGASVFGLFSDLDLARQAADKLRAMHPDWLLFHGAAFHRHPFEAEWRAFRERG